MTAKGTDHHAFLLMGVLGALWGMCRSGPATNPTNPSSRAMATSLSLHGKNAVVFGGRQRILETVCLTNKNLLASSRRVAPTGRRWNDGPP
jgi:hypothetical protein